MVGGEMPSQGFALTRMKHPPFDFIEVLKTMTIFKNIHTQ